MKKILLFTFTSAMLCLSVALIMLVSHNVQAKEQRLLERKVPQSQHQVLLSYAPVVKKTAPAVVNIFTAKKVQVRTSPFLSDPFFERFFGRRQGGLTRERIVRSLGSGVIIGKQGLVITNNHVVEDSDAIKVILSDRREFTAQVLMTDPRADLALLQMDANSELFPYLEVSDVDTLEVGDIVLAIGNPFGVGQTVTSGIVSALARTTVGVSDFEFFIQTDAAINPGNSGGALVNMRGELVGINTAIYTRTGGSNGIGFATPSTMAKVILSSYKSGAKRILRPWLGASTQNVTPDIAASLGMDRPKGALVTSVYEGGAASKAGLQIGDVVINVDEHDIIDEQALKYRIGTYMLGKVSEVTILRSGELKKLKIIMEPPRELPLRDSITLEGKNPLAGATVENLSPALADELGITRTRGVIVQDVIGRSYARRLVQKGDVIESINGSVPQDTRHLQELLNAEKQGWKLSIRRGDKLLTVSVAG